MKTLLNLAKECLRLITLHTQSALGGVAFCFRRLQESDIGVPEIAGSLITPASALISTLLEEPLGDPPRLSGARDATVRLCIDRRVGQCERCRSECEPYGGCVAAGVASWPRNATEQIHR